MGWLSHGIEGVKLGKVLSNYNFSWSIGTIISPFLTGLLSTISSSLPLFNNFRMKVAGIPVY